ncbi:protein Flattop isoform X2 [Ornithorhynchus anatinus]|uniref:protein Flattop isoform X2 n=1 Tax=Ornithorhynchus anatinus TaxID=9258 RepID=UPI0010A810A3|nr:protein Flattop isoform X2 [Ornithorhynchus anatinus]
MPTGPHSPAGTSPSQPSSLPPTTATPRSSPTTVVTCYLQSRVLRPWGTFLGTWEMPLRIPPAQLTLTARSAAGAARLTDWLQESRSLTEACNGLRPQIRGKLQEPPEAPKEGPRVPDRGTATPQAPKGTTPLAPAPAPAPGRPPSKIRASSGPRSPTQPAGTAARKPENTAPEDPNPGPGRPPSKGGDPQSPRSPTRSPEVPDPGPGRPPSEGGDPQSPPSPTRSPEAPDPGPGRPPSEGGDPQSPHSPTRSPEAPDPGPGRPPSEGRAPLSSRNPGPSRPSPPSSRGTTGAVGTPDPGPKAATPTPDSGPSPEVPPGSGAGNVPTRSRRGSRASSVLSVPLCEP